MMVLLTFLLLLLTTFPAAAQNSSMRLKLVFPFGDHSVHFCSAQYQTRDGCCDEDPAEMYTWSDVKGCCRSPKSLNNGKCCTSCDGTWISSTANTCGTCCPTWHAQPGLCCTKGADWITETFEGIDSSRCCPANAPNAASATFLLKGKNFSIAGCCKDASSLYAAPTSISYVAGTTSVNFINWSTGCCPYPPTSTALGGYQCCSNGRSAYAHYTFLSNHLLGKQRLYERLSTGCCTDASPTLIDFGGNQTVCCPEGVGAYRYSTANHWNVLLWQSYVVGCCPSDQPQAKAFTNGTTCCATGEVVTEFRDYSYYGGALGDPTTFTGYSPSCCVPENVRQTPNNGKLCCPSGVEHYTFMSEKEMHNTYTYYRGGCCTTSSPYAVPIGTAGIGTYCCPEGLGVAANLSYIKYYLSNVDDAGRRWTPECCTKSSPVPISLFNPRDSHDLGTLCCPEGVSTYTFLQQYVSFQNLSNRTMFYSFNCCGVGETPKTLPDTRGTYCCPNNSSAYTYQHSWRSYGGADQISYFYYSAGCCTASSPYLVQAAANQTLCCPTSHAAFLTANETFLPNATASTRSYTISCCGDEETAKSIMNGTQCCPTEFSAFGFRHSLSYFDTNALAEYKMSTGCCTESSPALVTIPGGWGTYCCPAGQTVTASIAYANNSRLRWVYPTCQ